MTHKRNILSFTIPAPARSSFGRRQRIQALPGGVQALADGGDGMQITDEVAWRGGDHPATACIQRRPGACGRQIAPSVLGRHSVSVYNAPAVWIDGPCCTNITPRLRPVSDFELGRPAKET